MVTPLSLPIIISSFPSLFISYASTEYVLNEELRILVLSITLSNFWVVVLNKNKASLPLFPLPTNKWLMPFIFIVAAPTNGHPLLFFFV